MTASVKLAHSQDVTPLQVASEGELLVVLLSNGEIIVLNSKTLVQEYKLTVPLCKSFCIRNKKIYAVCGDGKVHLIENGNSNMICNLNMNLACCTATDTTLFVGCVEIPHDGSLIFAINLSTLAIKKIEFSHFGDITNLKIVDGKLYSSGVDGLVCEYDGEYEVDQVYNGEASVCDFAIHGSNLYLLTDIYTVVVIDKDSGKTKKYGRPTEDLHGVCCLETRKGVKVLFTDLQGNLTMFKPSGKVLKSYGCSNIHESFVECATSSNGVDMYSVDDQSVLRMTNIRQCFGKHQLDD